MHPNPQLQDLSNRARTGCNHHAIGGMACKRSKYCRLAVCINTDGGIARIETDTVDQTNRYIERGQNVGWRFVCEGVILDL